MSKICVRMKLAKIILKIFGVVLCSNSPVLAEPSAHPDKVVDNNYTGYIEFGEDFFAKDLISPTSRNFLSPKRSHNEDNLKYSNNFNSSLCADSWEQNYQCNQSFERKQLTDSEKAHLNAFNFLRSYIPYLKTGNLNYLKDQLLSTMASKASSEISSKASSFLETFPFVLNASIDLDLGLDSDFTYGFSAIYNLASSSFPDTPALKKSILFGQTKVLGTTSSGSTWNVGIGGRKIINDNTMAGLNTFWDYRITPYDISHSRFGVGGELFWKDFELRNNWYIAGTGPQDVTINSQEYVERVVPGWDVEIGYRFEKLPELALFARTFRWDYQYGNDNTGLELSANYQVTPYVNLEAYTSNEIPAYPGNSNDNLSYDQWLFGLRLKFSAKPTVYKASQSHKERFQALMKQPVRRRYDVLLERKRKSTGTFRVSISGR